MEKIDRYVPAPLLPSEKVMRERSAKHLKWVRSHRCCIPGCLNGPSEAHHLKGVQPGAMGLKPSDSLTVPLCRFHHQTRENMGNESAFWAKFAPGFDPVTYAAVLWAESCSGAEMP